MVSVYSAANRVTSDTHRQIFAVSPFPTFHHGTMDFGNDGIGVRNTAGDVGNNGVGVRNDCICVYREFGLGAGDQRWPCRSNKTHVKDEKESIEVRSPGYDRRFIAICVEESRDRIPFTLPDDLLLDLRHGAAMESIVSGRSELTTTAGLTHAVNCAIASHTELLRSFNRFPLSPRWREAQTLAQVIPSST